MKASKLSSATLGTLDGISGQETLSSVEDMKDIEKFSHFLVFLHPLVKILAIFPLLIVVSLTKDLWLLAFIGMESIILLLTGSGISKKKLFFIFSSLVLGGLVYFALFALTAPKRSSALLFQIGPMSIYQAGIEEGLLNTIRVFTLMLLSFLFTGTTSVTTLLYSLMQQGRLSYRIGYTVSAAYHFVPVLWQELKIVHSAQRVRGLAGNHPSIWYQKLKRLSVTLFVSSIRRAERLALSMEARSFGAFSTCTYYRKIQVSKKDIFCLFLYWAIHGAIIWFRFHSY